MALHSPKQLCRSELSTYERASIERRILLQGGRQSRAKILREDLERLLQFIDSIGSVQDFAAQPVDRQAAARSAASCISLLGRRAEQR